MKAIRLILLSGLAAVGLTGCFDIEQSMSLNQDLSGTAGFRMSVNMEPMVLFMLRMQREMAGTKGEPTAAEIDKAKQDFLAQQKEKKAKGDDFTTQKADFEKSLPPGVQVVDGGVEDQGLKVLVHFKFRFDNVAKLGQIQFSKDKEQQPGPKNPFDQPFAGVVVKDEGKTVLLTGAAVNPLQQQEGQKGGPELDADTKKLMEQAFQGFRVAFKLESPMEVVESNATRRDGHTLYWEYDLKSVETMTKEQAAAGIRVRFKK